MKKIIHRQKKNRWCITGNDEKKYPRAPKARYLHSKRHNMPARESRNILKNETQNHVFCSVKQIFL